jgi:hypothetical protein
VDFNPRDRRAWIEKGDSLLFRSAILFAQDLSTEKAESPFFPRLRFRRADRGTHVLKNRANPQAVLMLTWD